MQYNLNTETEALESLFDAFNRQIFGGRIPKAVITVQRDGGLKAKGYFTPWEAWKEIDGEKTAACEIAITGEILNRSPLEIAETMLHEMVHAWNYSRGIKDCTRKGTFHNKKFAEAATFAGLEVTTDKKYGHITVGFEDNSTALKLAVEWDKEIKEASTFEKVRWEPPKAKPTKKAQKSFKYACPCCETVITAKSEKLHVRCMDCDMDFILQD